MIDKTKHKENNKSNKREPMQIANTLNMQKFTIS